MSNQRYTAVLATLFGSCSDATLDYAVGRYNVHRMVFLLTVIAFIGQLIIGAFKALSRNFLH